MVNNNNKFIFLGIVIACFIWLVEVGIHVVVFKTGNIIDELFSLHDPNELWMRCFIVFIVVLFGYISQRIANKLMAAYEKERETLGKLNKSLNEIKVLRGIIPICASCKKIRDDKEQWNQMESYIQKHSEVKFSHGLCPECIEKLYPEYNLHKTKE